MLRNISQLRSPSPRRGATNRAALTLIGSVILLFGLVLLLTPTARRTQELTISCAAGLREPMDAIRAAYEKEHGVHLTIHYGGSSTLLANLKLNHDADLFLPADDSYI